MSRFLAISLALALLCAACAPVPPPAPTMTPEPTHALVPTFTPSVEPPPATATEAVVPTAPAATAEPAPAVATATRAATAAPAPADTATPTTAPTLPPAPSATPLPTRPAAAKAVTPVVTRSPAATAAPKPTAAPVAAATGAWKGEYFSNPDLNGEPALVRNDADVNFDWGLGAPAPGIPTDHFSVRWTRQVNLPSGAWRFNATADDGVRVYVDGWPVIDRWLTSGPVTYSTTASLTGGFHELRVDYFDATENAQVHVWWAPDDGSATDPAHAGAWRGDYFNNRDATGTPVFSRDDPAVWFNWQTSGPGHNMSGQDFSVRWYQKVFLGGGSYLFSVRSDDGVRVWLDWATVIDKWGGSDGKTTLTNEVNVSNGMHEVVVEYWQGSGPALVELSYQPTAYNWVGNIHTCLPPQGGWIKVYRLAPNNEWQTLNADGFGANGANGQVNIFGVPVDAGYSWDGQPYKVEQWVNGSMAHSEGDIFAGQPAFRIQPGADVRTSWTCP